VAYLLDPKTVLFNTHTNMHDAHISVNGLLTLQHCFQTPSIY